MAFNFDDLSIHYLKNIDSDTQEPHEQISEEYFNKVIDIIVDNQYGGNKVNEIDNSFIMDYSFAGNTNIDEITLIDTSVIGTGAFEFCENLITVNTNKDNLPLILSHSSFANCTNLKEIQFICSNAPTRCFYNCQNIRQIILNTESNIKEINDECFCNCTELRNINLNIDSIKYIGIRAFYSCLSLRNITLSDQLETIDTLAFANCSLTTITIPKSVKYIETRAFYNNATLQNVIFEHTNEDEIYLNDDIFGNCPNIIISGHNNKIIEYTKANKLKIR